MAIVVLTRNLMSLKHSVMSESLLSGPGWKEGGMMCY